MKKILLIIFYFFTISQIKAESLNECKWKNKEGSPCLVISKTNNTSSLSESGVQSIVITKEEIEKSGFSNINDVFKHVSGLNVFQNGGSGQSSSIFLRGGESNHTLVLLNGIAINDQSVTDGMHDFGQDFLQTLQRIEIYKGASGVHFGPSAVSGAINLITAIDYQNSYTASGFNGRNNSGQINLTKIFDNGLHVNFNGVMNQSEVDSSVADGSEDDGTFNKQFNLSTENFIKDNLKVKTNFYVRETRTYYDDMDNNGEYGYVMDNTMQTFQLGFGHLGDQVEDDLVFHWHAYGKDIDDGGFDDSYDSQSLVARAERKYDKSKNLSFGLGSEYKYDWGKFENRGASFNSSSKGHVKDYAFFGNAGFKLSDKTVLSMYGRADEHNTAGGNKTYKFNINHDFSDFSVRASHSTGLRNPTLYELFGSNNFGFKGDINLKAETSESNEISLTYNFLENLIFKSTGYRTTVRDRLEFTSDFTATENKLIDLSHEGLENELIFKDNNQKISFFTNFSKSKSVAGVAQNRRPDLNLGLKMSKKLNNYYFGPLDLNLYYKHTGKYRDFDGSNIHAKSTDLIDTSISKNLFGYNFNLSMTNLLNEKYEKPLTYSAPGRKIRFGFRKSY
tara:strand:+ start:366 stop:2222 length:1857 start_codon:yes stop_codon:yes gene_type:complete